MNCKPGDLAVMVGGYQPSNYGKLFRVIDRHRCDPGEWRVEALCRVATDHGSVLPAGSILWADDYALRPIRQWRRSQATAIRTAPIVPEGIPVGIPASVWDLPVHGWPAERKPMNYWPAEAEEVA